jgi:AraC-like DNA-binding protein
MKTKGFADSPALSESEVNHRAEPAEIWKARRLIDELSAEEISLTKVAVEVHISSNYLSEKFKHVTGVNFVQYVARIRTRKAAEFLINSDSRVTDIAFAAGFQSLSQFNRVFKKLTQQSPSQFRAAHRPPARKREPTRGNRARHYR